jgi:hypothetical protein
LGRLGDFSKHSHSDGADSAAPNGERMHEFVVIHENVRSRMQDHGICRIRADTASRRRGTHFSVIDKHPVHQNGLKHGLAYGTLIHLRYFMLAMLRRTPAWPNLTSNPLPRARVFPVHMPNIADRVVRILEDSIDRSLAASPVSIVIMGPGLDEQTPAAKLRRRIVAEARAYGAVIQPEHRGLTEAAKAKLKSAHNLAIYETHLVKISDLVVLIPDSPGSLCELGLFSASRYCNKMLILMSTDYPKEGSYVADGPLKAASHSQAEIVFLHYTDQDRAWVVVRERIEKIRVAMSLGKLMQEDR